MDQLELRKMLGICGWNTQWKSYPSDAITMSHLFAPPGARKDGDLRRVSKIFDPFQNDLKSKSNHFLIFHKFKSQHLLQKQIK